MIVSSCVKSKSRESQEKVSAITSSFSLTHNICIKAAGTKSAILIRRRLEKEASLSCGKRPLLVNVRVRKFNGRILSFFFIWFFPDLNLCALGTPLSDQYEKKINFLHPASQNTLDDEYRTHKTVHKFLAPTTF